MNDEITFLYGRFVNRDNELTRFCKILDEDRFIVMVVHGEEGIGKTSLQKRLIYECREVRKMRWAETFQVDKTRSYNYLTVMRKIRDAIGPQFFGPFTDLLNYFTSPNYTLQINVGGTSQVEMLKDADLKDVKINQVIGQNVVIQDLNIDTPREDKMIREEERMHKLTQQFLKDLSGALTNERVAILIDDVDQMPPETQSWLWNELVRGVLDQGLMNIRFVCCVKSEPQLNEFMKEKVHSGALRTLNEGHIIQYLEKRQVGTDADRKAMATMIMGYSKGQPLVMRSMVDAFIKQQSQQEE